MHPKSDAASVRLKRGVYLALLDGEGVLMDIASDQYLALDAEAALIWKHLEEGRTPSDVAGTLGHCLGWDMRRAQEEVERQIETWREWGLIVSGDGESPNLPQAKLIGRPASQEIPRQHVTSATLSLRCLARVMLAKRWLRRTWRQGGLGWTLHRLQRELPMQRRVPITDLAVCRTVKAFRMSRLPFRQGEEDCLARSLHLTRALRAAGVQTDICFGVQKFPFRAHAWAEVGGYVVSDSTFRLNQFALLARF